MNTNLTIKNFRVFDANDGGNVKLAPITLLTGCNSSGKSSVVKALLLLKDFFNSLDKVGIFKRGRLDFGNSLAKLGGFDLVRNSNSVDGSKITISYVIYSQLLDEEIVVELTFNSDKNDALGNGWLSDISIKKIDGCIIFDAYIDRNIENNLLRRVHSDALQIRTNNLSAIRANYMAKVIKEFAVDDLYIGASKESLKSWIDLLVRYAPTEKVRYFVDELNYMGSDPYMEAQATMRTKSPYQKNKDVYMAAFQLHSLFPMPILETLSCVDKKNVRNTIYNWLDKAKDNNTANDVNKDQCHFEYIDFLDQILTLFEESEYGTLLEYFYAAETKWLESYELQADYSGLGEDLGIISSLQKFAKWPRVIDEYHFGYIEKISLGKNGGLTRTPTVYFNKERFGDLFNVLYNLDKYLNRSQKTTPYNYINHTSHDSLGMYDETVHTVYADFRNFYRRVLQEVLLPKSFTRFEYVGDASMSPQRLYTREQDDLFGKFLFEYLEACRSYRTTHNFKAGDFINKWIKAFEIGDHLSVTSTAEGYGVIAKLHKSPEDKKGVLLADEGWGITKLIGTLINVELQILKTKPRHEILTIAVEEPENHLHPKFQSMLAEMFADAYKNYGIHFIVETHSEYMVRKLQTIVAKKQLTPEEVSLQYFNHPNLEHRPLGEPQVKDIPIREDGILQEPFGPGFLDEADNLAMDILTIKTMS